MLSEVAVIIICPNLLSKMKIKLRQKDEDEDGKKKDKKKTTDVICGTA